MTSITKRAFAAVFAAAQINGFGFFYRHFDRREFSGLVTTVAKGLAFTQSTRAPVIAFASFDVDSVRRFLSNFWLHGDTFMVG